MVPKELIVDPKPFAVLDNDKWSTVVILKVLNMNHENYKFAECGPHLSLIYDNHGNDKRRRMNYAARLSEILGNIDTNLIVSAIEIWDTNSNFDVSKWEKVWGYVV